MSAVHVHHLWGCAPTPLAHYLKALGILRLVAEQKDPTVRGWWQDEHFCLLTALDHKALEKFFLEDYAPTPFVSPWNKGSGFFGANDKALALIEGSTASRLSKFREGILAARDQLAELAQADKVVRATKDRTKAKKGMSASQKAAARNLKEDAEFKKELAAAERAFKALKGDLFGPALRSWRGAHRSWMDTAVVVIEGGETKFPSLLGTGGNDGRLDFTNNAMQRIVELFDTVDASAGPRAGAKELLLDALWSGGSNKLSAGAAVGQFFPASAGGANMTTGPEGASRVNPWDFVLALEGTLCLSARATRRLDPLATREASAPFAVQAHGAGFATRGGEGANRGEQWVPLWAQPTGLNDLLAMLGEARVQLGRQNAHRPIDALRAIARVGVARGLSGFLRYAYLERNGQSNIAVPLGRVDVQERPHSRLIDDLAPWLDRLQWAARDKNAPARFQQVEGRLADAVFAALTHDESPDRWQAVLLAAAGIEALQSCGTGVDAGPIPPLSVDWVRVADDGSVEWRLACALGSAAGAYDHRSPYAKDPVRAHWLPLEPGGWRFRVKEKRLVADPRVVMTGREAINDCIALLERRIVESTQGGRRSLPLVAAPGCGASPSDLADLIGGTVHLPRVLELARALMAVRWDRWTLSKRANAGDSRPEEAWTALRLATLPWPLDEHRDIPVDGALIRRLRAGDGAGAVDLALRRLRAAGLRPPIRTAAASLELARRWAAALAFPISNYQALQLARPFEPVSQETR